MNEKISYNNAIITSKKSIEQMIDTIIKNMLNTRPREEVEFYPYAKCDHIKKGVYPLGFLEINLAELFSQAANGDFVYIKTILTSKAPNKMVISLCGACDAWFNNQAILSENSLERVDIPVDFLGGNNELIFRCEKNEDFFAKLCVSVPRYPGMWACDYLFYTYETLPQKEFSSEIGVAVTKLYKKDDEKVFVEDYIFPHNEDINIKNEYDFTKLSQQKGIFFALTYLKGEIKIEHFNETWIFVNGEVVATQNGAGILTYTLEDISPVLIKCVGDESCGFRIINADGLSLPVKTAKEKGLNILWCGPFCDDSKDTPEFNVDYFKKPFISDNKKLYWRFLRENTYLRPRLNGSFFGHWFYALMVGLFGIKTVFEFTKNDEYLEYFNDSIQIMADYFDLMQFENEFFGAPSFLWRSLILNELDSIGTMGMNFVEQYNHTKDKNVLNIIEILKNAMENQVPRMENGVFYRVGTMWADDIFMSCPFLVRLGNLYNEQKYYYETFKQIMGYKEKLWLSDKKIFAHIYFPETKVNNNVPWGRGNGWIFLTLSDVLMKMPKDFENYNAILELFREYAKGVTNLFDFKNKMWHQVLNEDESYLETSCTGMFIIGLSRGVQYGWLPNEYRNIINLAWEGLCTNSIDIEGAVYGVCMGSGCSMDKKYYFDIPTIVNDDHGTGIILTAACEIAKMDNKY